MIDFENGLRSDKCISFMHYERGGEDLLNLGNLVREQVFLDIAVTDRHTAARPAPAPARAPPGLRRRMKNELNFPPNFERLVLGCIGADFCK